MTLGAWLVLGAGCVLPGEFDTLSDQCDPPFFDSPTRDEFCSGSIEARQVTQADGFNTAAQPLVQVQGRFISVLNQDVLTNSIDVQILEEDELGLGYNEVVSRSFDTVGAKTLTGFALMGNLEEVEDVDDAKLALIYDRRDLQFVDVVEEGDFLGDLDGEGGDPESAPEDPEEGDGDPMEPPIEGEEEMPEPGEDDPNDGEGDPGGPPNEGDEEMPEGVDGGDEVQDSGFDESELDVSSALLTGVQQEQLKEGCTPDDEGKFLRLVDLASLSSDKRPDNSYLIVAVRCAMLIYGQRRGQPRPIELGRIVLRAQGVEVDRSRDRLYLATGFDGLYVRSLSDLEADLDAQMAELYDLPAADSGDDDEASLPSDAPEEPLDTDEQGNEGEAAGPRLEEGEDFTISDPGRDAVLNAAEVAFAAERVFFINAPVSGTDREEDNAYYLVAGELNDDGLLERRYSLKLEERDEEAPIQPQWQLVGLQDTLVAVLKTLEGVDAVSGDAFSANTITIYDAPPGQPPVRVAKIDLLNRANAIDFKDGELWVFHNDFISAYKVGISGDHY